MVKIARYDRIHVKWDILGYFSITVYICFKITIFYSLLKPFKKWKDAYQTFLSSSLQVRRLFTGNFSKMTLIWRILFAVVCRNKAIKQAFSTSQNTLVEKKKEPNFLAKLMFFQNWCFWRKKFEKKTWKFALLSNIVHH